MDYSSFNFSLKI